MDNETDPLAAAGLTAADDGVSDDTAAVPDSEATPPAAPGADDGADDEEIVVPEGAKNPDAVQRAIAAERKAAREANARRRELEAELARRTEEERPLEERISNAEQKAKAAELKALKFEVAAESGLTIQLASRLSGTTREELLEDAESLKPLIGSTSSAPTAPPDGGVRTPPPAKKDPAKEHNSLIGALLGNAQASRGSRDPLAGLTPAPADDE